MLLTELKENQAYCLILYNDQGNAIYYIETNKSEKKTSNLHIYSMLNLFQDFEDCANYENLVYDTSSEFYKIELEDENGIIIYKNTII